MTDYKYKYSNEEMEAIHDRYYEPEGFIRTTMIDGKRTQLKKLDKLFSLWSNYKEQEIQNNDRYVYDVLELDKDDCIRFNLTKAKSGCACSKHLTDRLDLVMLRDFLNDYLNIKPEDKYPQ